MKPDGFFSLQFPWLPEGRNRAYFFLECDRSTETRARFREKLEVYASWYQRGGQTEALGIKRFRVLTVTKSEERLRSLLPIAPPDPIFWFTSGKRFTPEQSGALFEPIWETPERRGSDLSILPGGQRPEDKESH